MKNLLMDKTRKTIACQRWIYFCDPKAVPHDIHGIALLEFHDKFPSAMLAHTQAAFGTYRILSTQNGVAFLSTTIGDDKVIVTLQLDCGSDGEPRDAIDAFKLSLKDILGCRSMKSDDDVWHIVDEAMA